MQIELDVSLENPTATIDLNLIKDSLISNKNYEILQYQFNNFIFLKNICDDLNIRVHKDGRIYVIIDNQKNDEELFMNLLFNLKKFIFSNSILKKQDMKKEINFSIYGNTSHSFFWKKYNELNQIGKEFFLFYDIKTYTNNSNSIYVKLESSKPTNIKFSDYLSPHL
jgi:hypothetical protein